MLFPDFDNTFAKKQLYYNKVPKLIFGIFNEADNTIRRCYGKHKFIKKIFICSLHEKTCCHIRLSRLKILYSESFFLRSKKFDTICKHKHPRDYFLITKYNEMSFKYFIKIIHYEDGLMNCLDIKNFLCILHWSYIIDVPLNKRFDCLIRSCLQRLHISNLNIVIEEIETYRNRLPRKFFNWILLHSLRNFFDIFGIYRKFLEVTTFGECLNHLNADISLNINLFINVLEKIHKLIHKFGLSHPLTIIFYFCNVKKVSFRNIGFIKSNYISFLEDIFQKDIFVIRIYDCSLLNLLTNLLKIKTLRNAKKIFIAESPITNASIRLLSYFIHLEILSFKMIGKIFNFSDSLKYFSYKSKNLMVLEIYAHQIISDLQFLEYIIGFKHLKIYISELNFDNLAPVFSRSFTSCMLLTNLRLPFNNINLNQAIERIYFYENLQSISFQSVLRSGCAHRNNDFEPKFITKLKTLYLTNFFIGNDDLFMIYSFKNLKKLSFKKCSFNSSYNLPKDGNCVISICKFENVLESLEIINCDEFLSFFNFVYSLYNLKKLVLNAPYMSFTTELNFLNRLRLSNLSLFRISELLIDNSVLQCLSLNSNLTHLYIYNCPIKRNYFIDMPNYEAFFKKLVHFSFICCDITIQDTFALSHLTNCETLDFSFSRFISCSISNIFKKENTYKVKNLNLKYLFLLYEDSTAINRLKNLTFLNLSDCILYQNTLCTLKFNGLKNLQVLNLSGINIPRNIKKMLNEEFTILDS
ncbi:hypothetical protein CWI37_0091p0010 [Hamiltosporidium tvaerminnensis]|uniref:Leucine-rich repeat-containing protein n=1 Tax=Hamiltosporidium tvaerminnensis TaxID=1176355 RepID=A0A4Q9LDB7_9MICR|nr:hypothetical protein CWI37_0091p0010 [Hamiltosporidium tvaerminnensis]